MQRIIVPFDMAVMMAQRRADTVPGSRAANAQNRSTSPIMSNITSSWQGSMVAWHGIALAVTPQPAGVRQLLDPGSAVRQTVRSWRSHR
jgi:hypothetical protein